MVSQCAAPYLVERCYNVLLFFGFGIIQGSIFLLGGEEMAIWIWLIEGNVLVKLLVVKGVGGTPKFQCGFHTDCGEIIGKLRLKECQTRAMEISLVTSFARRLISHFLLVFWCGHAAHSHKKSQII
jgi:hypothetical protein